MHKRCRVGCQFFVQRLWRETGAERGFLSAPCVLSLLLPWIVSWVLSKPSPGNYRTSVFVGDLPGLLWCTMVAALCNHNCLSQPSPHQVCPASETSPTLSLSQFHMSLSLVECCLWAITPEHPTCSSRFPTHICSCCLFISSPLTSHVALCLLSVCLC